MAMNATYTLAEANRLVPLLRSIAGEIVERRAEKRLLRRLREQLGTARTPEGLRTAVQAIDSRLTGLDAGISTARHEFEELGLEVLRMSPLTIHIPGRTLDGPVVFCWQIDEDEVHHGHLLGEEESARRPLQLRNQDGGQAA
jgi:hypothetical protein